MKEFADNCGACGKEYLSSELTPTKLGGLSFSEIKICPICLAYSKIAEDFTAAAELIVLAFSDAELQSPNIVIEPVSSVVQKAVNLLKQLDSSYFVGVRKIIVSSSLNYGHVESGPGKDPALIYLNLGRLQNENISEKDLVRAVALTIAHERGHVLSFKQEAGFQGGEGPAQAEEQRIGQLIDNLPEYKNVGG